MPHPSPRHPADMKRTPHPLAPAGQSRPVLIHQTTSPDAKRPHAQRHASTPPAPDAGSDADLTRHRRTVTNQRAVANQPPAADRPDACRPKRPQPPALATTTSINAAAHAAATRRGGDTGRPPRSAPASDARSQCGGRTCNCDRPPPADRPAVRDRSADGNAGSTHTDCSRRSCDDRQCRQRPLMLRRLGAEKPADSRGRRRHRALAVTGSSTAARSNRPTATDRPAPADQAALADGQRTQESKSRNERSRQKPRRPPASSAADAVQRLRMAEGPAGHRGRRRHRTLDRNEQPGPDAGRPARHSGPAAVAGRQRAKAKAAPEAIAAARTATITRVGSGCLRCGRSARRTGR
jgi:hypothetical protein